jgi:predicted PurR-regulated permease PerM
MTGWRIALWVALVAVAVGFLWLVRGVLLPFAVALVIVAVLEPAVRMLRRRGMARPAAVSVVLAAFFGVIIGAMVLATPTVVSQVTSLSLRAQDFTRTLIDEGQNNHLMVRWDPAVQAEQQSRLTGQVDRLFARYGDQMERIGLPGSRREFMVQYVDRNRPRIAEWVNGLFDSFLTFIGGFFGQIGYIFMIPIIVTLAMFDLDTLRRRSLRWIPPSIRPGTTALLGDIGDVFFQYLRGISTLVLLYGIAQTLMMLVFGVPYAILFGLLFAALYLIPFIGNIISMGVLLLVVGFSGQSGNAFVTMPNSWAFAGLVVGLFFIIGFIFDNFVVPRVVGGSVGLSPVLGVFVVLCGSALAGLPGMILAYPLAGAVKVVLDRVLRVTGAGVDSIQLPALPLRHRRTAT